MMDRWRNKVAIVTGASAGIGAAVAESLVREGLQVVGLARRVERIEALSERLADKPGRLYALKTDLGNESEIDAAFDWVKTNLGPIHILVNNAGIASSAHFINPQSEDWRDVLNINLTAVLITTKKAIKDMRENGVDGHIVQVSSLLGHQVPFCFDVNVYAVAKHGITALTEVVRQELCREGSKIKVSNISPGFVATEIVSANNIAHLNDSFETSSKLTSEDIASAILFILGTPAHVQIQDMMIKPIGELF